MALTDKLARIDDLKNQIDARRPIKPEQERRIMDKFRLDWNYHSNAIEGNRLTLGETRVLLLEGLTAHGKPLKDSLDIKGHNEVINYLEAFVHKKEILTEVTIRGLHKILLHEPYQVEARTPDGQSTTKWVKLGEYKTEPNFAQSPTGVERPFILPQDVPARMHALMQWFNTECGKKELHPLIIAAFFHHRFAQIHPFDDGNGRMARILMNLIAMQHGLQPVIIKTERKEAYISALIKADAGETDEFLELIADEEIHSQELFLRGAHGEDISDLDDIDKQITLLKQELSNVADPLILTPKLQTEFILNTVIPCLNKLSKKLGQFDELYNENSFVVNVAMWNSSPTLYFPSPQTIGFNKDNYIIPILNRIKMQEILISSIEAQFSWQGFKKAGVNTFSDRCELTFRFQSQQYSISSNHAGNSILNYNNIYQNVPDEEQILKIVNKLVEVCLKHIQDQVKLKK